ncbi:uncharacterized protein FA14DRAFT_152969 [Meira miltonrushii]|uniref:Uncharacterized protein n=1 Tax=Meira miltonrushii TaxID=1280837 RepID=A0A316VMH0_9BASI|nr:uncharacterized protein FA14DRAFT_152969 [Meira miltonrushii]PWN37603.1 hypothetical protein FA14DRAFT_152969 [Meira miltonrushii]
MHFKLLLTLFFVGITGALALQPQARQNHPHEKLQIVKREPESVQEQQSTGIKRLVSDIEDAIPAAPLDTLSQFEQTTQGLIALIAKGGLSGDPTAFVASFEALLGFGLSTVASTQLPSAAQFAAAIQIVAQFVDVCQDGSSGIEVSWITKAFASLTAEGEGVAAGLVGSVTGTLGGVL